MKNFSIYKYKRVRNAKLLSLFVLYFDQDNKTCTL